MLFSNLFRSGGAILLVALGLTGAQSMAGTIRHDRDDALYRALAADPQFESVGKVTWSGGIASGTLVNDDWVLTAGHVGELMISKGLSSARFTVAGSAYTVAQVIVHDDWNGNTQSGDDLALFRLTDPIDSITPSPIYTGNDEQDAVITLVGYGKTGTGLTGDTQPSGTKRAGNNLADLGSALNRRPNISGYTDQMLVADFDNPNIPRQSPLDLEYLAAPGDSGGSWFIEVDGEFQIAGVTSFLLAATDGVADADYGDYMGATRVSRYLDWIEPIIADPPLLTGDANSDGQVDGNDLIAVEENFGATGEAGVRGDANSDGQVDGNDLITVEESFGNVATDGAGSVPEPIALSIYVMGLAIASCGRSRLN